MKDSIWYFLIFSVSLLACDNEPHTVDSCGDGFVDSGEQCDGADLDGASCASLLFYNTEGALTCSADCRFVTTECGVARCGDGMIQGDHGEQCDGTELGGASCLSLGYERGDLGCTAACRHDVSDCVGAGVCGDGVIQTPEQCDGNALNDQTCQSLGFHAGTLVCDQQCQFRLDACIGRCGDGVIDSAYQEQCDDVNLDLQTCESLGLYPGTLACGDDCRFELAGCGGSCGDGVLQSSLEQCDGALLDGQTCESQGHHPGVISCGDDCRFELAGCGGSCGDGVLQSAQEQCDGALLDGQTCVSLGQYPGTLACAGDCSFELAGCGGYCGDGLIQTAQGESCDLNALDGQTCASLGLYPGTLACAGDCRFDLTGCGGFCGDGYIQTAHGEACEGAELGSSLCLDVQKFFGTPACDPACDLTDGTCRSIAQWNSASGSSAGWGLAIDGSDNVYVAGNSNGPVDGQPYVSNGDVMLSRYSANGQRTWTRMLGTGALDIAYAAATDTAGNIYITGATGGALDGQTHSGGNDVFLIKYNASGVRLWTRLLGTTAADVGASVSADGAGDVYVAGYTMAALDGQAHQGDNDAFLVKYNASGARQWTRQWGTALEDMAYGVISDGAGGIYVTGYTLGALAGQTSAGGSDLFLVKFNDAGVIQWVRQKGTASADKGQGVVVSPLGAVHVTGYVSGAMDGQSQVGGRDLVLLKYDASGTHQWTRLWGTSATDEGWGVALDGLGNILVTGSVAGSLDGQPHMGGQDIFLSKFNSDGNRLWSHQWGTSSTNEPVRGVRVNSRNHAFIVGNTTGSLDGVSPAGSGYAFLIHDPNIP